MLFFKPVAVFSSFLFTVLPFLGLSQHLRMHDREFYILSNKSLVGNVTATKKVKNFFDCSFLCLEHGPFACLSFNFGTIEDNGYHNCELSNSERYLEPLRIHERLNYDYYGTTTETLFSLGLLPCASSPCNYGGTCIQGSRVGEFSCQCGIEGTILPFIDDVCNVDFAGLRIVTSVVQGVFQVRENQQHAFNYYDAERLCEIFEARLATYDQLFAAWQAGLQQCATGWLADGTARFPMQEKKPGCGNMIGIGGSTTPRDKINDRFNAWCYEE
ncbi:uncharacterized protein LOC144654127 [Oculina patagonica]